MLLPFRGGIGEALVSLIVLFAAMATALFGFLYLWEREVSSLWIIGSSLIVLILFGPWSSKLYDAAVEGERNLFRFFWYYLSSYLFLAASGICFFYCNVFLTQNVPEDYRIAAFIVLTVFFGGSVKFVSTGTIWTNGDSSGSDTSGDGGGGDGGGGGGGGGGD